ncbi:MAG TPA: hypothetical protein VFA04_23900 [Bryobacteraceae bacterium]|nr:hypothetical protein [Bryobacteraceae bacterium]
MQRAFATALFAMLVFSSAAFAQPGAIPTPVAAPVDSFQLSYVANLDLADATINLTNTGTLTLPTGLTTTGNMCVNVYAFDPTAVMIACCSCLVAPNAVNSLSVNNDIRTPSIGRQKPTSMAIKLLATTPLGLTATGSGGHCDPTSPTATPAGPGVFGSLVPGMRAWQTSTHRIPAPPGIALTEFSFTPSTLSPAELTKLVIQCGFLRTSGIGMCNNCQTGGQ